MEWKTFIYESKIIELEVECFQAIEWLEGINDEKHSFFAPISLRVFKWNEAKYLVSINGGRTHRNGVNVSVRIEPNGQGSCVVIIERNILIKRIIQAVATLIGVYKIISSLILYNSVKGAAVGFGIIIVGLIMGGIYEGSGYGAAEDLIRYLENKVRSNK